MSLRTGVVRVGYDTGGVLASFVALLAVENLVVGVWQRAQFVGTWEMAHARLYLSPIALGAAAPLAVLAVALGILVANRSAVAAAVVGFAGAALVGYGVSTGRHFGAWPLRAGLVVVLGAGGAAAGFLFVRLLPRGRPHLLAFAGAIVSAVAWLADVFVLPRLYPALHGLFFVVVMLAWSATWLAVRGKRGAVAASIAGAAVALLSIAWTVKAARAVAPDDNLRRVLLERAPILGRGTLVAARLAPPKPLDDAGDAALALATIPGGERALDWAGHDIVLVTIDALRADHVGAYGYERGTTPAIDRLAARGARFDHAYCPTPHTSYSVASMMTGKYMRPLLALGVAESSDTWATYLRRYGYRTAAFYPPAVFYIDEQRFRTMHADGLGFEYRKEEFAPPDLRRAQIDEYLARAPTDKPLFLWVHLFEPHEPYEKHLDHDFGDDDVARYDSEIAEADALTGDIVGMVERRRPGAVVVVTADHGEELGDHGGRYHGTTVYEEQVRVPLVVVGPGIAPRVVATPVQTIDLLPTTLSALDVPRPARLRGRDLGGLLAGRPPPDEGLAFAETDDWTMLARGSDRLVCARKIASCTLFDVATDPGETKPVADRPARVEELRKLTAAIERENGRVEAADLPEALRRALQGDRDAAEDAAALLDDARVDIRRAAARAAFKLKAPEIVPQLRRAAAKDEDAKVRAFCALAVARVGDKSDLGAASVLVKDADPEIRLAAALTLAEHGDKAGEPELVLRWRVAYAPLAASSAGVGELDEARELLAAFAKIRARSAVPYLTRALDNPRLRGHVVDALERIGDPRAKAPLAAAFAEERYVDLRPKEARALLSLGAREEVKAPLLRFAGVPEPIDDVLDLARDAGVLRLGEGGWAGDGRGRRLEVTVRVPGTGAVRLFVRPNGAGPPSVATVNGVEVELAQRGADWVGEVDALVGARAVLHIEDDDGLYAALLVRRAPEIPPPPPRAWTPNAEPEK